MNQIAEAISPNAAWSTSLIRLTKGITIVVALACMILTLWIKPIPVSFNKFPLEALLALFTKLIAIALFIERTVEVLLTPWRGLGSHRMTARVKQAKAKLEDGETDLVEMSNAEDELREYKGQTKQIAFLMALALGMTISAVGFRGLEFFVDPESLRTLSEHQTVMFRTLDVLVTGALLAGKADGLHKMVLVFTSHLDKSKEKLNGAT